MLYRLVRTYLTPYAGMLGVLLALQLVATLASLYLPSLFGQIIDELNDNLDEYSRQHRDVRKAIPKLLKAIDDWSGTLSSASDNEAYNVVRKIALDNLKDTREITQQLQTELDAWFKAHPEALKEEKKRNADPHAVRPE